MIQDTAGIKQSMLVYTHTTPFSSYISNFYSHKGDEDDVEAESLLTNHTHSTSQTFGHYYSFKGFYFYNFPNCRIIGTTSKIWNKTYGIRW